MKFKLLIVLLIFIGCKNKSEQTYRTYGENRIYTVENKYEVLIPKSLNQTDRLNDLTDFQFENIDDDLYVIILDQPKQTFYKAIEDKQYNEQPNLTGYCNTVIKHFNELYNKFIVYDISRKKLNSSNAVVFSMTGISKEDGIEDFYRYAVIESDSRFYQIMSWTKKEKEKNVIDRMNQIIMSFKVKEQNNN
jgi:hypothetical protein